MFISARYLYFLAKAGHAPAAFGSVWPNTEEAKRKRAVVPWVGVLTTVAFATLSWLCVRPGDNTESEMEKVRGSSGLLSSKKGVFRFFVADVTIRGYFLVDFHSDREHDHLGVFTGVYLI